MCCGSASPDKPENEAEAKRKYLDRKSRQIQHSNQVALGLFGGVYNYNKTPWWAKKAMDTDRPRVESTYKAVEPGVYDTRDWSAIKNWAEALAKTVTC